MLPACDSETGSRSRELRITFYRSAEAGARAVWCESQFVVLDLCFALLARCRSESAGRSYVTDVHER